MRLSTTATSRGRGSRKNSKVARSSPGAPLTTVDSDWTVDLRELHAVVERLSLNLGNGSHAAQFASPEQGGNDSLDRASSAARIEKLNEALLTVEEERDVLRTKLKVEQERSAQLRRELEALQAFKELHSSLQRRNEDLQESLAVSDRIRSQQRKHIVALQAAVDTKIGEVPLESGEARDLLARFSIPMLPPEPPLISSIVACSDETISDTSNKRMLDDCFLNPSPEMALSRGPKRSPGGMAPLLVGSKLSAEAPLARSSGVRRREAARGAAPRQRQRAAQKKSGKTANSTITSTSKVSMAATGKINGSSRPSSRK